MVTFAPNAINQTDPRLQRQYALAQALMGQGVQQKPIQHWTQGLAQLAQAYAGTRLMDKADEKYDARRNEQLATIAKALGVPTDPTAAMTSGAPGEGQPGPTVAAAGRLDPLVSILAGNPDTAPYALQYKLGLAQKDAENRAALERQRALYTDPEILEGKMKVAQAGRNMTSINMPAGELERDKAEGKKVGEFYGEAFTKGQESAATARAQNARLDRLDGLLDQVQTGKFAGTMVEFKAALKSFGMDPEVLGLRDDVDPAQAAAALSNQMALELRNPAGGAGMPGALSDKDREFLTSMVPGVGNTREGRKLMIETYKKVNQRSIQVAKMMRDYRKKHGRLDEQFFDELQAFSDANPLFQGMVAPSAPVNANDPLGLR